MGTTTRSTPKGFAESITTSVGTDRAKRAPLPNFGDGVAKFATRTFGCSSRLRAGRRSDSRASVRDPKPADTRCEHSGQLEPTVGFALPAARAVGPSPSGDNRRRLRSTPPEFQGVLAPRIHPVTRDRKWEYADSPLRSYSVVASKDTGGGTPACSHARVRPKSRKTSRPIPRIKPGAKRRRGRANPYGPTTPRDLRSPDEPHERTRAHWQQCSRNRNRSCLRRGTPNRTSSTDRKSVV